MPTLKIRVTGSDDDASAVITALHSLDFLEHVEEVEDLMPHMDDDDSSSAGLPDDMAAGVHTIEVIAPNAERAEQVRELADAVGADRGIPIEYVDDER